MVIITTDAASGSAELKPCALTTYVRAMARQKMTAVFGNYSPRRTQRIYDRHRRIGQFQPVRKSAPATGGARQPMFYRSHGESVCEESDKDDNCKSNTTQGLVATQKCHDKDMDTSSDDKKMAIIDWAAQRKQRVAKRNSMSSRRRPMTKHYCSAVLSFITEQQKKRQRLIEEFEAVARAAEQQYWMQKREKQLRRDREDFFRTIRRDLSQTKTLRR